MREIIIHRYILYKVQYKDLTNKNVKLIQVKFINKYNCMAYKYFKIYSSLIILKNNI